MHVRTPRQGLASCEPTRDESCMVDMMRASGDMRCTCGLECRKHPYCPNAVDVVGEVYVLHVLCDGTHVKL